MPDDLDGLRRACEGLSYPSETDSPLVVFQWSEAGENARQAVAQHTGSMELKEISVEEFFDCLAGGDSSAERIHELQRAVGERLASVQVYRAGAVQIRIFLIGQSRSGKWSGIETFSVET